MNSLFSIAYPDMPFPNKYPDRIASGLASNYEEHA